MIAFEDVSKAYRTRGGSKIICSDIKCTIPHGVNLGILGINGAGKSTLMRLIAGIEEPDRGRIRRACSVSFPLGFSGTFAGSLSGRENAIFLARIYGAPVDYVVEYAQDFADIGDYFDEPVNTYSSGMRSRLAFGVSMAIEFDVYLVDEVTAVGDQSFQEKCTAVLNDRFAVSSVIMISHASDTLRQYCDWGAVLHDGQLKFYHSIDDATDAHFANMRIAV
jgi:capsular polysaccharide transport system ATP-binding protein